jgi:hypothetical protein
MRKMRVEKARLEQQSKKGQTEKNEKSTQMVNLNRSTEFSLHSESKSFELATIRFQEHTGRRNRTSLPAKN